MPDTYSNFADLSSDLLEGRDFRVACRNAQSVLAVIAPHGGGIEPGTSEIANAVAGDSHSFYAFEGIKPRGNSILHITSSHFDEPRCLALVEQVQTVLTIHGCDEQKPVVFIGGLDDELRHKITIALNEAKFRTSEHDNPRLQGIATDNICNRGASGVGVQLELAHGLRRMMFNSLSSQGRINHTAHFVTFTQALRSAISDYLGRGIT